jgi:transposase
MSLHPEDPTAPPEETQRVARAAFPKGTLCLDIADALGPIYRDSQFAGLFPQLGQPAAAPAMLALATVLQYLEGLSDRQAADAVRGRIDWKYALRLPLTDPGFDHTVLSEFRSRLIDGKAEQRMLDTLLDRLRDLGLVKPRGRQRTDSTHVLAAVRGLNRLERVGETLRAALNEVAVMAPAWLQALAPAEWYERYARRVENYRLPKRRGRIWRRRSAPTDPCCYGRSTRRPASPGWRRSRRCRLCGGSSSMSSGTGRYAGVRSRTCLRPPP